MEFNKEQIVRDFKQAFTSQAGEKVLAYLENFCRAQFNQSLYDLTSDRQTCYNLGANSVYRHIRFILNQDPDETPADAIIEETPHL